MTSTTDELQPPSRNTFRLLEATALLGSLAAVLATFPLLGRGAAELNPLVEAVLRNLDVSGVNPPYRPPNSPVWYAVGLPVLVALW